MHHKILLVLLIVVKWNVEKPHLNNIKLLSQKYVKHKNPVSTYKDILLFIYITIAF